MAGRREEALASYDVAIRTKPTHTGSILNRATLLSELARAEEAIAGFHDAAAVSDNDSTQASEHTTALLGRGHALLMTEKVAEAERSYGQAAAMQPHSAPASNGHCHTLHRLGRLVEAEAACRRALAADGAYAWAWYNLGVALAGAAEGLGRASEAEWSYRRCLALQPTWASAWGGLAAVQRGQGLVAEAEDSLRRAAASAQPTIHLHPSAPSIGGWDSHGTPAGAVGRSSLTATVMLSPVVTTASPGRQTRSVGTAEALAGASSLPASDTSDLPDGVKRVDPVEVRRMVHAQRAGMVLGGEPGNEAAVVSERLQEQQWQQQQLSSRPAGVLSTGLGRGVRPATAAEVAVLLQPERLSAFGAAPVAVRREVLPETFNEAAFSIQPVSVIAASSLPNVAANALARPEVPLALPRPATPPLHGCQ